MKRRWQVRLVQACGIGIALLVVELLLSWLWARSSELLDLGRRHNAIDQGLAANVPGREHRCVPTNVTGLHFCPQLADLTPLLLQNKRALLRLALDAVADVGDKEPLQLIKRTVETSADVFYSLVGPNRRLWNEGLSGGTRFLDWLDAFYTDKLYRRRPPLVYVTGRDLCSLLADLTEFGEDHAVIGEGISVEKRNITSNPGGSSSAHEIKEALENNDSTSTASQDGTVFENKTPLALITAGWDGEGSPFMVPEWGECAYSILKLPGVVRWFVSHHEGDNPGEKVEYLGIGFGGLKPRSGLQQSTHLEAARNKLRDMEYCDDDGAGTMDLLFMCNNASPNTPRPKINAALYAPGQKDAKVIPENRYPLEPKATVEAGTEGFFAISPEGTRPDGFRHYEFLLAGNIVYIPDSPSLRYIFANLPVVFVEGGADGWAKINCDTMEGHAKEVAFRLQHGLQPGVRPPYQYEKLTLRYWTIFLRDRVWAAGAAYASSGGNDSFPNMGSVPGPSTLRHGAMVVGP